MPRPQNAWILYRSEKIKLMKEENSAPSKIRQSQYSQLIGHMWRNETPEVRARFEKLAEESKIAHALKYPNYQYAPIRKSYGRPTSPPGTSSRPSPRQKPSKKGSLEWSPEALPNHLAIEIPLVQWAEKDSQFTFGLATPPLTSAGCSPSPSVLSVVSPGMYPVNESIASWVGESASTYDTYSTEEPMFVMEDLNAEGAASVLPSNELGMWTPYEVNSSPTWLPSNPPEVSTYLPLSAPAACTEFQLNFAPPASCFESTSPASYGTNLSMSYSTPFSPTTSYPVSAGPAFPSFPVVTAAEETSDTWTWATVLSPSVAYGSFPPHEEPAFSFP
ncbi:hypothetical protein MNV49_006685 [Pseudohyphozyma bogoriensis]|nr:hypothetical protein MNV49_006685 [Pseudohyphozyma bogoriensis]